MYKFSQRSFAEDHLACCWPTDEWSVIVSTTVLRGRRVTSTSSLGNTAIPSTAIVFRMIVRSLELLAQWLRIQCYLIMTVTALNGKQCGQRRSTRWSCADLRRRELGTYYPFAWAHLSTDCILKEPPSMTREQHGNYNVSLDYYSILTEQFMIYCPG